MHEHGKKTVMGMVISWGEERAGASNARLKSDLLR